MDAVATRPDRVLCAIGVCAVVALAFVTEDAREPNGPLPVDQRVLDSVVGHRAPAATTATLVTQLGNGLVLMLAGVAAGAVIWTRRRDYLDAVLPWAASRVAWGIELTMKQIIDRPRPPTSVRLETAVGSAFPSGHTAAATAFFVTLALVAVGGARSARLRIGVPVAGAILGALVGVSRVVLGVHWASDVVGGWCLGVACSIGAVLARDAVGRRRACEPDGLMAAGPPPTPE